MQDTTQTAFWPQFCDHSAISTQPFGRTMHAHANNTAVVVDARCARQTQAQAGECSYMHNVHRLSRRQHACTSQQHQT